MIWYSAWSVGGFPSRTCIGPETPQAVMVIHYSIHYPCMDEFLTMNKFDFPAKIFIPFCDCCFPTFSGHVWQIQHSLIVSYPLIRQFCCTDPQAHHSSLLFESPFFPARWWSSDVTTPCSSSSSPPDISRLSGPCHPQNCVLAGLGPAGPKHWARYVRIREC